LKFFVPSSNIIFIVDLLLTISLSDPETGEVAAGILRISDFALYETWENHDDFDQRRRPFSMQVSERHSQTTDMNQDVSASSRSPRRHSLPHLPTIHNPDSPTALGSGINTSPTSSHAAGGVIGRSYSTRSSEGGARQHEDHYTDTSSSTGLTRASESSQRARGMISSIFQTSRDPQNDIERGVVAQTPESTSSHRTISLKFLRLVASSMCVLSFIIVLIMAVLARLRTASS
jgi:hypothetical protein